MNNQSDQIKQLEGITKSLNNSESKSNSKKIEKRLKTIESRQEESLPEMQSSPVNEILNLV